MEKIKLCLIISIIANIIFVFGLCDLFFAELECKNRNCNKNGAGLPDEQILTDGKIENETAGLAAPPQINAAVADSILKLAVDDNGFSIKGVAIGVVAAKDTILEVSNKGTRPHSFVIDGLGIDSGEIAPGGAKTIDLGLISGKLANYDFYSNGAGDESDVFKGIIMVVK